MKPFDFKEKRLTKDKPEKECFRGNYKKQKSYGTIKNEVYSGFMRENSNPENMRTKTVALSGSLVLNSKLKEGKNLIGTVAVPMNWLHLNQVATMADIMARDARS